MTTKIITAALAFFTTFGFSTLMMQFALDKADSQTPAYTFRYGSPEKHKVLRFLERDIRNGRERMGSLSRSEWQYEPPFSRVSLVEYSESVSDYVNKSGSMDDSELPHDLRCAWREHMKAWSDYSDFLNNLSVFDGEQSNIRRQYAQKEAKISTTWYKVLGIAGNNYGAFPANAY